MNQNRTTQNGINQNGITQNGITQNGITQNGITQNGNNQNSINQNLMSHIENDLVEDQLILYAMDELDFSETDLIERMLESSPELQQELAGIRQTLGEVSDMYESKNTLLPEPRNRKKKRQKHTTETLLTERYDIARTSRNRIIAITSTVATAIALAVGICFYTVDNSNINTISSSGLPIGNNSTQTAVKNAGLPINNSSTDFNTFNKSQSLTSNSHEYSPLLPDHNDVLTGNSLAENDTVNRTNNHNRAIEESSEANLVGVTPNNQVQQQQKNAIGVGSLVSTSPHQTAPNVNYTVQKQQVFDSGAGATVEIAVVPDNADFAGYWEYCCRNDLIEEPIVRNTVRYYQHHSRFTDIITVLETALRDGQPSPWMYEALALAQICSNRPKQEYERTLMSAVDFCSDYETMLLIALRLSQMNLPERSLAIYKQLAQMYPDRTDPYVLGLRIARRLNDQEGLRWSALGILSHEWDASCDIVRQEAENILNGMVAELKKANQSELAQELVRQINEARQRDCVVRVTWTGNADVDLIVEEPAGTWCKQGNHRTTSGGVLVRDGHPVSQKQNQQSELSETYICTKGFDGDYHVLIKNVWGEVVGNRVKVELIAHQGSTELERRMASTIELNQRQAGMMFTLRDGRRTQPLEQQKLAQSVQSIAEREVLAQQIAGSLDAEAMNRLSRIPSSPNRPFSQIAGDPLWNNGNAVGYQPQIVTLPTGTNFVAQAVVSADRRYVRITSVPLFSYIASVRIFNYIEGTESEGAVPGGDN